MAYFDSYIVLLIGTINQLGSMLQDACHYHVVYNKMQPLNRLLLLIQIMHFT